MTVRTFLILVLALRLIDCDHATDAAARRASRIGNRMLRSRAVLPLAHAALEALEAESLLG